jgi:hypothetical protein
MRILKSFCECPGLAIITNRFDWATSQRFLASCDFSFVFRLLADVGVRLLERPSKVCGRSFSADVAIYAGRIDVEGAVNIVLNFVVGIGHGSADYADRTNSARCERLWQRDKGVLLISGAPRCTNEDLPNGRASAPHRDRTGRPYSVTWIVPNGRADNCDPTKSYESTLNIRVFAALKLFRATVKDQPRRSCGLLLVCSPRRNERSAKFV